MYPVSGDDPVTTTIISLNEGITPHSQSSQKEILKWQVALETNVCLATPCLVEEQYPHNQGHSRIVGLGGLLQVDSGLKRIPQKPCKHLFLGKKITNSPTHQLHLRKLKKGGFTPELLLQVSIFRCHVTFRGCTPLSTTQLTPAFIAFRHHRPRSCPLSSTPTAWRGIRRSLWECKFLGRRSHWD